HVRIIPMPRPGVGLQPNLRIQDAQHAEGATTSVRPFHLGFPLISNVTRGAPQVSTYFFAPEPRLRLPPFADAEHNGTATCIQRLANQRIRCLGILGCSIAPVVLQIINAPRRILQSVLKLMTASARPARARFRASIRIDSKLQTE